ncbi:SpoIIE family protein phosphatase [Streptomyces sp. NPDC089424]|uniref:SpoIIE family protein phosphatase n=1 Tax=Streptomyces sp. NPDC089424 TaxID=3365917 RepID=UPI003810C66D
MHTAPGGDAMNQIEPTPSRTQQTSFHEGGQRDFLLTAVKDLVRNVHGAAATVFLRASDAAELRAAVVAVTPLGIGSVERVSLDDEVYPSARAWRTNSVVTAHGPELMPFHPDLSVFAPFPLQIAAAPISHGGRKFGTITVYWPRSRSGTAQEEIEQLVEVAADIAIHLGRLSERHGLMEPPAVPFVVSAEWEHADAREFSSPTVPLIYHVHKLAMLLANVVRTSEAIKMAMDRVIGGFSAEAVIVSLVQENRLQIADASGCSPEFIRTADWARLGKSTPETDAVVQQRHALYAAHDQQTRGRLAEQALDEACDWLVSPLLVGKRSVGALSIAFKRPHRDLAVQQSALTALATALAQAVDRTQTQEARHVLVEKLQQALLPRMLPQPAGVVSTGRYAQAASGTDIGGDWYDLLTLPTGGVAMVIGDVEGHNPAAAAVMGQLRSAVRAYADEGQRPGEVLERANHLLISLDTDLFATCCCLWLDPDTGVAELASAGHPLPLIHTADGIVPSPSDLDIGMPLGVYPNTRYTAAELALKPDTIIACFTDGLISLGSELDAETLKTALGSHADIESLADQIMKGFGRRRVTHTDDAALLLVCYEGPSSEAQRVIRQLKIHRRDLQGTPRARKLIREWLDGWDLSGMADEEELLLSEVVTNGLVHGDSDVYVVVRKYPDRVRVEVRDSDPHRPRTVTMPRQEDEAEGGRGLMIVSALASAWGNSPSGRGKTVWFELPVPA